MDSNMPLQHQSTKHQTIPGPKVKASLMEPLLRDLGPTLASQKAFLASSGPAERAAKKQTDKDNTPKPDGTKPKNPLWTIEEDKLLCVAWLNVTRDPIVGTGQKAATFWERVAAYQKKLVEDYNTEKKRTKGFKELPFRLTNATKCRQGHIMKVCSRFGGCYGKVKR
ncbi:uncharacterized protein PGTG_22798 [Puccinia graminis f. sp. tritici CRL 75-36-700-3]|uniref:No apical meristem-associated C-terminal domain-containing protein n=1 Tax=Puccinia graminis f. sp. tritici (strain CRL 75-36-700-3 / race SCCL) TaxID=418459 RepID=H6QVM7_PUCGT|nr:uncharacterized protein PGTG_22798 [Puccinia graminis f. sp. tritici CRL 75-36-700-3]EHS63383.1 hypothetical protein PGTG_22798 [Puccinia graminis f. sp. tritici CRL 75-36-700-3]